MNMKKKDKKNKKAEPKKTRQDRKSAEKAASENLLIAYRNGDAGAFDRIIEQHGQQIYNFVLRLVGSPEAAEDIFQDTFVRVLRNIENYKPAAKLLTWLIQIAKNLCYDYFKKERHRSHMSLSHEDKDDEYSLAAMIEDPEQLAPELELMSEEDQKLVREAIQLLSLKKKEVI